MLSRDQLSLAQVARLAGTQPVLPIGDPRQQAFQRALAGQVGQTLQAQVLSKLEDGSYVVRMPGAGGLAARMPLPATTQVGTQLALTLVALQPRPTFQVDTGHGATAFAEAAPPPQEGAAPQGAALAYVDGKEAAALARNTALLAPARGMAALANPSGTEGANTSISRAGRAIGDVLAAARQADTPASAAIGRAPLLPAASADAGQIAAALRQGLEHSGLFYESHVAEWAQGTRTLAELRAEPQARGAMPSALDPATAQFINLQLGVQEQGRVAWQGQLWPGQDVRWEIDKRSGPYEDEDKDREGADAGGPAEPADGHWESRLRLRFGALGEVAARVVLSGDRLYVRLDAESAAGAHLRAARAQLAGALDAAGTPLATLAIHERPADG